jgi:hypothetical protein
MPALKLHFCGTPVKEGHTRASFQPDIKCLLAIVD